MCRLISLLILVSLLNSQQSVYAQLPQNHDYQIELRNFIASLDESDFEIEIKPLDYEKVYGLSDDEQFKTWILRENRGRAHPGFKGLSREARYFTIGEIEKDDVVYLNIGRNGFHEPIATAWWVGWDFPGNPYHGSRAVKLRAAVSAMVDMMMLEEYHKQGKGTRSDFAGTSLLRMGFVYGKSKDVLPEQVQNSYKEGMLRLLSRIEEWGPTLIHADMDMFAVAGVWAVAEAMESDAVRDRARRYVQRVFDGAYREAGYIHHGLGFDPSYQGITFGFAGWAAMLSNDPFLIDKLEQMSRLKAHLSFPDPDGKWHGPSNFATSNDAGSPNDQWESFHRDIGIAMLTDEAKYLIWSGRERPEWYMTGIYPPWDLRDRNMSDISRMSEKIVNEGVSDKAPEKWKEDHWTNLIPFSHEYYVEGTYQELWNMQRNYSPLMKAPVNREENFEENFGDEFLIAKRDSYAIAVHTGRLSDWGDEKNISGLGGGGISAFWKPETGSLILGKQRGFQNNKTGPDTWDDWRMWPVHAISGQTDSGKPFSSARQRVPESKYEMDGPNPAVSVWGSLNDRFAAPDDAISGNVTYQREFEIHDNGVKVRTKLQSDEVDKLNELYEIIPIFIQNRQDVTVDIFFKTGNGEWKEATSEIKENVTSIRADRFDGSMHIELESPQSVRLSPEVWHTNYQTRSQARNVMISMLENATTDSQNSHVEYSIAYTVR